MKLSRSVSSKIRYVIDEFTPPIVRDSKWFIYLPFKLLFGSQSEEFFTFKERAYSMSDEEFANLYRDTRSASMERISDLNDACLDKILHSIAGTRVLEVGCGNAYLASKLSENYSVSAADIVLNEGISEQYPRITFVQANSEKLPFGEKTFDTVVCTHTLEHVLNLNVSIAELRRVCAKRLIVVVPQQRPYRYTFDLHLHFFPYPTSLLAYMGTGLDNECVSLDGDLFYIENIS